MKDHLALARTNFDPLAEVLVLSWLGRETTLKTGLLTQVDPRWRWWQDETLLHSFSDLQRTHLLRMTWPLLWGHWMDAKNKMLTSTTQRKDLFYKKIFNSTYASSLFNISEPTPLLLQSNTHTRIQTNTWWNMKVLLHQPHKYIQGKKIENINQWALNTQ